MKIFKGHPPKKKIKNEILGKRFAIINWKIKADKVRKQLREEERKRLIEFWDDDSG